MKDARRRVNESPKRINKEGDEGVKQWLEKVRKLCDHVKEADGIVGVGFCI